mgnify:CR=1 FL=1
MLLSFAKTLASRRSMRTFSSSTASTCAVETGHDFRFSRRCRRSNKLIRSSKRSMNSTNENDSEENELNKNRNENRNQSKPQNELIDALDKISKREDMIKRKQGAMTGTSRSDIIVKDAFTGKERTSNSNSNKTNTVMGPGTSEEWRALDERVNTYPCERKFQAIGLNEQSFVRDIVKIVEDCLGRGPIGEDRVTSNLSKNGKYVSANVTVVLESGEEVIEIMSKLKADGRVKWYL